MSADALRCADAIRRVGADAALIREGEKYFFPCSLQPRISGAEDYADPIGCGSGDYFTMFAPCDTAGELVERGDCIAWRDSLYYVQKAETYTLYGEPMYRWAVVRRESGG